MSDRTDKIDTLVMKALETYEVQLGDRSRTVVGMYQMDAARDILDWFGGGGDRPGTLSVKADRS